MIRIEVSGDLTKKLTEIERDLLPKAVKRSLKRTVASLKTEIDRIVRKDEQLNLKKKEVSEAISTRLITGSRVIDMAGTVRISSKPIPLFRFMANQKAYGSGITRNKRSGKAKRQAVKVRVRRGSSKIVKGGFVATMPGSGRTGIFKRIPGTRMKAKNKEQIEELYSTSVRDVFRSKRVMSQLTQVARTRYAAELRTNLDFYVSRKK